MKRLPSCGAFADTAVVPLYGAAKRKTPRGSARGVADTPPDTSEPVRNPGAVSTRLPGRPSEQPGADVIGHGPEPFVGDALAVNAGHVRYLVAHDVVGG